MRLMAKVRSHCLVLCVQDRCRESFSAAAPVTLPPLFVSNDLRHVVQDILWSQNARVIDQSVQQGYGACVAMIQLPSALPFSSSVTRAHTSMRPNSLKQVATPALQSLSLPTSRVTKMARAAPLAVMTL